MIYDIVICMHSADRDIAIKTIKSLHYFLNSRRIYVITSSSDFKILRKNVRNNISLHFVDENAVIKNLDLSETKNLLAYDKRSEQRANWYFQQLLKMGIALHPEIANHYLIWDSDTILFQSINFLDDSGAILFNKTPDIEESYFDLIDDLLGIKRQVNYSFINEHLMIKKEYMIELINVLQEKSPANMSWDRFIFHTLKKQTFSYLGWVL